LSKVLVKPENYGILNMFLGLLFIIAAIVFFTFAYRASIHELTGTVEDIEMTCSTRACIYEFSASISGECCLKFNAPETHALLLGDEVLIRNSQRVFCRVMSGNSCETYKYVGKLETAPFNGGEVGQPK
jgi:hypothetical protein